MEKESKGAYGQLDRKKVLNNTGIFRNSDFNRLFIKHAIHHCAMYLRLAGAC